MANLLEYYDLLPDKIVDILSSHDESYSSAHRIQAELKNLGYRTDYGLDGQLIYLKGFLDINKLLETHLIARKDIKIYTWSESDHQHVKPEILPEGTIVKFYRASEDQTWFNTVDTQTRFKMEYHFNRLLNDFDLC